MLKYIEHIDKLGHRGQAWIGFVEVSRSGRTVYFNGMALQRIPGGGVNGNHRAVQPETNIGFPVSRRKEQTGIGQAAVKYLLKSARYRNYLSYEDGPRCRMAIN